MVSGKHFHSIAQGMDLPPLPSVKVCRLKVSAVYWDTQRLADSLKAEVVDLQQKETAQAELKQAKKEVQTEKLKGAATTAATNIAESVGSLFGGGKMKALERRNEDLQDRILKLEEEARQRENQQAKQIQDKKTLMNNRTANCSSLWILSNVIFPMWKSLYQQLSFCVIL